MGLAGAVRADGPLPPWNEPGEPPPPAWARSVAPKTDDLGYAGDLVAYAGPSRTSNKRGVTRPGTSLPFFGERRGTGCTGRWWLVGPLAWTCSDDAELSPAAPQPVAPPPGKDGGDEQYFFVQPSGASAYQSLESAQEGTEDRQLEGGWAVGVVDQRTMNGARWALTTKGLWIAAHDLMAARPSTFHGEAVADGHVDFAWVLSEKASTWSSPDAKKKPTGTRPRFDRVTLRDSAPGDMLQVDGGAWMAARDLARPSAVAPPSEVTEPDERWIDVDTSTQTLVAYEGPRPVYATLVSTGRGAPGTDSATPRGVHRIWVKLVASDMDNVEREDLDQHYSMQDVPYVQFFEGAVALHGTYWHRDFGHVRSHGCVNLAPDDARWLFAFTSPQVPPGWAATYPTPLAQGTIVRVR
jgi:lipoprotein-anchoring transpeptidase ErfK/SrfK